MGALDFSLEDLEITVTDNTEDTAGDDAVAVQDVQEAEEQVENMLAKLDKAANIINNLTGMAAHIQKFGVTAPMLDLHNKNNKLGRAIGMTLPTVESDDEPGDVEGAAADVEVEIVVESIGEKVKGAKQWIIDFFKKIYLTLKDYYVKYLGLANRLEKRLKKIKSTILGKNIERSTFDDYKASLYEFGDFQTMVTNCTTILGKTGFTGAAALTGFKDAATCVTTSSMVEADFSKLGYEFDKDDEPLENGVPATEAKRVTTLNVVPGGEEPTKEHETLGKLNWSFASLNNQHGKMLDLVKKMKEVAKMEKAINKAETAANKAAKTALADANTEKVTTAQLVNLTKTVRFYIQAIKAANRVAGQLVIMYCSVVEKAKVKS